MVPVKEQMDVLCRGVVDVHVRAELEERIGSGKPLRVKAGFDPTRPDLHVGHVVLLQKMAQFQELGHEVVFLVGDFTAMVGDPTGRNELRPRLTREEVRAAAETYQVQAFKVLDRSKTVVRYNSEWLDKLDPSQLVELCAKYTVARMLERDDFQKRFAEQRAIFIHEFLYPLLQAYDSVALECDIELGGTDQLFNLLVGRDLMPRYGLRPQMVLTTPLLEGTNARMVDGKIVGAKMSKSAGNYVGITEAPFEMVQKLMLIDDQVIWRYIELLSRMSNQEIAAHRADVQEGKRSVVDVKEVFAREMVTRFHSAADADAAIERRRRVAKGELPDDAAPEVQVPCEGETMWIAKALATAGLAKSTSEGKRLVENGAVHLDGRQLGKPDAQLGLQKGQRYLVRVGTKNRRFAHLLLS
jgi:tyrosyl-tRNA synthetase